MKRSIFLCCFFVSISTCMYAKAEQQKSDQYITYLENKKNQIKKYVYGIYTLAGISFLCAEAMGPHGRIIRKKMSQVWQLLKISNSKRYLKFMQLPAESYSVISFILKCFFHIPSTL